MTKNSSGAAAPQAPKKELVKFTDRFIESRKPQDEVYYLTDGGCSGLEIWVYPSGVKSWKTKFTKGKTKKEFTLGRYTNRHDPNHMGVAEARQARGDVRLAVSQGGNPAVERGTSRDARVEKNERTFKAEAIAFHAKAQVIRNWSGSYTKEFMRKLEKHVFPVIGKMPIDQITRKDIKAVLDGVMMRNTKSARGLPRGGIVQADMIRGNLSVIFDEWLDDEIVQSNPATRLKKRTKIPTRKPQPSVKEQDGLRDIMTKIEASNAEINTKLYHRFLALTCVRSSEARLALWEQIEGDVWHVPASAMKGKGGEKKDHTVYLSAQALEVLAVARERAQPGARLIFPTDHYGVEHHEPMNRSTLGEVMKRTLGARKHVPHGWRSAARTTLNIKFHQDGALLEMLLAHDTKDAVRRAYDHSEAGDYKAHLRRFWAWWADYILPPGDSPSAWTLIGQDGPTNVVPLHAVA